MDRAKALELQDAIEALSIEITERHGQLSLAEYERKIRRGLRRRGWVLERYGLRMVVSLSDLVGEEFRIRLYHTHVPGGLAS